MGQEIFAIWTANKHSNPN